MFWIYITPLVMDALAVIYTVSGLLTLGPVPYSIFHTSLTDLSTFAKTDRRIQKSTEVAAKHYTAVLCLRKYCTKPCCPGHSRPSLAITPEEVRCLPSQWTPTTWAGSSTCCGGIAPFDTNFSGQSYASFFPCSASKPLSSIATQNLWP